MQRILLGVILGTLSFSSMAWENRYELRKDPYGNNIGGSSDVEMRNRLNPDPTTKYRGSLDNDGSIRMRNYNGDTLRGTIDSDGYGRLRDQNGNSYRVRPR